MKRTAPIMFDTTAVPTKHNFRDLTGARFGRLTVVRFAGMINHRSWWVCKCACGTRKTLPAHSITRGLTRSCGCLDKETKTKLVVARSTKHGEANRTLKTPEYRTWCFMKTRCLNPRSSNYQNYGGRGIAICKRWANSFDAFLTDMGRKPSAAHSIDRINNDGNYEPGNCRWATRTEQNRNTRRQKGR